ncbi:hypothetical protein WNB94_11350 [Aquabacterium sp. A3]|uniref:hypothetical protein n=1 Tax=Aquabacterium sp. A3 TaxID=3132829 RepID=UPI00311A52B6
MSLLHRLPKNMPPLDVVLHDIFSPKPAALAAALGVDERTVRRWIAANEAPRPVMLALFWLTRWGMQWTDADLYNEAQLHFAMNRCQAQTIRELRTQLARMGRIGSFGAANDPAEAVVLPLPAGTHPVRMCLKKRQTVPDAHGRNRRAAGSGEVGLIRERVCKRPTSYHHFVQRKRSAA